NDLGGTGDAVDVLDDLDVSLTMAEHFRRCLALRSARALLVVATTFGVVAWALPADLSLWMRDRWNLIGSVPHLVFGLAVIAAVPAVIFLASRAEVLLRESPRVVGQFMVSAGVATAASLALLAV